jgi:hypothetical protein
MACGSIGFDTMGIVNAGSVALDIFFISALGAAASVGHKGKTPMLKATNKGKIYKYFFVIRK